MQPYVILHRDSEWHPAELVAIVDAQSAPDALRIVGPYIMGAGDTEPDADYRAEPLADWRYDAENNRVGPFDL